jgi:hypothetical protein
VVPYSTWLVADCDRVKLTVAAVAVMPVTEMAVIVAA